MRVHNLTPHTVTLQLADGTRHDLPAEAPTPRCTVDRRPLAPLVTEWGPIPVTSTSLLPEVTDLPDAEPDTVLIVARPVAEARPGRADLYVPDDLVRDPDTGRVIACRSLARLSTVR
ncbi:MAG: hypothetical protein L0H59_08175 [Tomitella sp.]|nr:hypothetical protein [Tomitella sp.]